MKKIILPLLVSIFALTSCNLESLKDSLPSADISIPMSDTTYNYNLQAVLATSKDSIESTLIVGKNLNSDPVPSLCLVFKGKVAGNYHVITTKENLVNILSLLKKLNVDDIGSLQENIAVFYASENDYWLMKEGDIDISDYSADIKGSFLGQFINVKNVEVDNFATNPDFYDSIPKQSISGTFTATKVTVTESAK